MLLTSHIYGLYEKSNKYYGSILGEVRLYRFKNDYWILWKEKASNILSDNCVNRTVLYVRPLMYKFFT
jgi:hypothetical protein